jgi:hypothetical protein
MIHMSLRATSNKINEPKSLRDEENSFLTHDWAKTKDEISKIDIASTKWLKLNAMLFF